ncbi:MAG: CDP-archaeol synthase [Nitrosomonas sp.]|nr:CDP-archaeol synthase [Nitrosomonas sp.]
MDWPMLSLLFLILVANGSPILLRYFMRDTFSYPMDCGYCFVDNKRLLGNAKTWRGLMGSLLITSLSALMIGYDLETGLLVASGAMGGDILSSFLKRRLGIHSSARAPLLDQIPESLVPALLLMQTFQLSVAAVATLVLVFFLLDVTLSRLLYQLGIRKKPY